MVELHLPMAPRFTAADPRIDAVRGCLAVERGPEVLCLESVDLAAATDGRITDVGDVRLDPSVPPQELDGSVVVALRPATESPPAWPYTPPDAAPGRRGRRRVRRAARPVPRLGRARPVDDARVAARHVTTLQDGWPRGWDHPPLPAGAGVRIADA